MTPMLPRPLDPLRSFKLKVSLIVGIVLVLASVVFWIGAGWQFRYTLLAALVVSLAATQFVAHGMTSPLREATIRRELRPPRGTKWASSPSHSTPWPAIWKQPRSIAVN